LFRHNCLIIGHHCTVYPGENSVYGKKSFPSKESDTKILQGIYFAYKVGIISSYSNRIKIVDLVKIEMKPFLAKNSAIIQIY